MADRLEQAFEIHQGLAACLIGHRVIGRDQVECAAIAVDRQPVAAIALVEIADTQDHDGLGTRIGIQPGRERRQRLVIGTGLVKLLGAIGEAGDPDRWQPCPS